MIAIGTRMPDWIQSGFDDYVKRLPREWKFELIELPVEHRGKNADIARLRDLEGERILRAIPEDATLIVLDERGDQLDTVDWSKALIRWQREVNVLCIAIGGPDGHAPAVLARAGQRCSLSKLTFPHALVRVIAVEQLYRAWSVTANHPYHRV